MLRYCLTCTARYAPDLTVCPSCGTDAAQSLDAPGGEPDPAELNAARAAKTPPPKTAKSAAS